MSISVIDFFGSQLDAIPFEDLASKVFNKDHLRLVEHKDDQWWWDCHICLYDENERSNRNTVAGFTWTQDEFRGVVGTRAVAILSEEALAEVAWDRKFRARWIEWICIDAGDKGELLILSVPDATSSTYSMLLFASNDEILSYIKFTARLYGIGTTTPQWD